MEELEDHAAELGDAMAREIMQQVRVEQADDELPKTSCSCSVCGSDGKLDEVKPRLVQTRRGDVTWPEPRIRGLNSLNHLLAENAMNASDLARLLDVYASMESKILRGEHSLTVNHFRKLASHFKVSPRLFLD